MSRARDLLTCWIVAMWVWGHSWAKYQIAVRRSRWRHFYAVEFVPPKGQRWCARRTNK